ncbi:hypothetical protein HDU96_007133 [Phlyctochytrium bullatum]|nr:hypothetical protein HDU96_007133 [Phlyctochytrium bullatum]
MEQRLEDYLSTNSTDLDASNMLDADVSKKTVGRELLLRFKRRFLEVLLDHQQWTVALKVSGEICDLLESLYPTGHPQHGISLLTHAKLAILLEEHPSQETITKMARAVSLLEKSHGRQSDFALEAKTKLVELQHFLRERGIRAPRHHPYSGRIIQDGSQGEQQAGETAEAASTEVQPDNDPVEATPTAGGSAENAEVEQSDGSKKRAYEDEDVDPETASKRLKPGTSKVPPKGKTKVDAKSKGKGSKKQAQGKGRGKGKKGKKNSDDESENGSSNGFDVNEFFEDDKPTPRSNFSRRRQADAKDFKPLSGHNGLHSIRFCDRCLRKFVPEDEETTTCLACLNIPSDSKRGKAKGAWAHLFRELGPRLEELFLENAAKLSKDSIENLEACCNLNSLILSECQGINDEGIKTLASLKSLRTFVLDNLGDIKDDSLVVVLKGIGHNLNELGLNGFANMEDQVLIEGVSDNCKNLEKLSLKGNENLTDEGMTKFMNSFQSQNGLRYLDLSRVINLKDGSLSTVVTLHGHTIEHLFLNNLDYLTEYSLKAAFDGGLPKLAELDISWVRAIDEDLLSWSRGGSSGLKLEDSTGKTVCRGFDQPGKVES